MTRVSVGLVKGGAVGAKEVEFLHQVRDMQCEDADCAQAYFVYVGVIPVPEEPVPMTRVTVGFVKGGIVGAREVEFLKDISAL